MIPFEEMNDRLKAIEKTRAWLVEASGRSEGAIRSALAPNAKPQHRSELLQKALSDAIESEEAQKIRDEESAHSQDSPPLPPEGFSAIYLQGEDLERAEAASRHGPWSSLAEFCREAIKVKAEELLRDSQPVGLSVLENPEAPIEIQENSSASTSA